MKRPQSIDPEVALVLRLTIFVLLVFGSTSWQLSVFLRAVCGAMLVFPSGATSRLGWLAILAMETYANASLWYRIDNHKYLINYWTLACCLYVANDELDKRWLCVTAKRLVGLCFLFALAWKLIGGEYLDGTFFEHTLITDARFADVATRFGGLSDAQLEENHRLIGLLKLLPSGTSIPLNSSVTTHQLAVMMSGWTLFIEGITAVLWLLPDRTPFSAGRDVTLAVFIVSTYFLVPVLGFAVILCVLALATDPQSRRRRHFWVTLVFVMQFASIPWLRYFE